MNRSIPQKMKTIKEMSQMASLENSPKGLKKNQHQTCIIYTSINTRGGNAFQFIYEVSIILIPKPMTIQKKQTIDQYSSWKLTQKSLTKY